MIPSNLRTPLTVFLIAFLAGACTSVPRAPVTTAGPQERVPVGSLSVGDGRPEKNPGADLVRVAAGLIGTPYKYGGDSPRRGFDCSGLVFYSFDQLGVEVPRTAADQRHAAQPVSRDDLTPGDLVFFRTSARRVDHVGIYAGEGKFIHSPRSGSVVSYGYLDDPYYRSHFVSAGRLPTLR
jgi:cell wall-associated NlpC family hydrolase